MSDFFAAPPQAPRQQPQQAQRPYQGQRQNNFAPAVTLAGQGDRIRGRVTRREIKDGTWSDGNPKRSLILTMALEQPRYQVVKNQPVTSSEWAVWVSVGSRLYQAISEALTGSRAPENSPAVGDLIDIVVTAEYPPQGNQRYPSKDFAVQWEPGQQVQLPQQAPQAFAQPTPAPYPPPQYPAPQQPYIAPLAEDDLF